MGAASPPGPGGEHRFGGTGPGAASPPGAGGEHRFGGTGAGAASPAGAGGEHRFGGTGPGAASPAGAGGEHRPGGPGAGGQRPAPVRSGGGHPHGPVQRNAAGRPYVYAGKEMPPVRAARYRWPAGGSYHRYAEHTHLPRAYWIAAYFLADLADYGLATPAAPYQWVRYGPDALLINLDTGEVIDAVYGVFDESAPPDDAQDDQPPPDQSPPDQPPPDQAPPDQQSQPVSGPAAEANAGLDALDRGDDDAAIRLLSEALASGALSPADRELAYVSRAKAYAAENNAASALADVNAALALNPGDPEALYVREELDPQSGSLQDTLNFIVRKLNGQGTINFSLRVHDSESDSDAESEASISLTDATANASQCVISYQLQTTAGGSAENTTNVSFNLSDIHSTQIVSMYKDLIDADTGDGHENRSYVMEPVIYDLNIQLTDSAQRLAFRDLREANKVQTALERANRLCLGFNS